MSRNSLYVGGPDLYVFAANGRGACSGSPTVCQPRWLGDTPGPVDDSPAVVGEVAYVVSDGALFAFDAAGNANCGGTPVVCDALWTATAPAVLDGDPVVASGTVYVGSEDGDVYGFDGAGTEGCSGSPVVCAPTWVGEAGGGGTSAPAVSTDRVYVGTAEETILGFQRVETGCSAAPGGCPPVWTATEGGSAVFAPAVADSMVFSTELDEALYASPGRLHAFDAGGVTNCAGDPVVCAPVWKSDQTVESEPAIADGRVYVSDNVHTYTGGADGVLAFDADGVEGCDTTTGVCDFLWIYEYDGFLQRQAPVVANGVVYVVMHTGLVAFNAEGGDCEIRQRHPDLPFTRHLGCDQIFSQQINHGSRDISPVVSNNRVYTYSAYYGEVKAFGLSGS